MSKLASPINDFKNIISSSTHDKDLMEEDNLARKFKFLADNQQSIDLRLVVGGDFYTGQVLKLARNRCYHSPNNFSLPWSYEMISQIQTCIDMWQLLLYCLLWVFSTKIGKLNRDFKVPWLWSKFLSPERKVFDSSTRTEVARYRFVHESNVMCKHYFWKKKFPQAVDSSGGFWDTTGNNDLCGYHNNHRASFFIA